VSRIAVHTSECHKRQLANLHMEATGQCAAGVCAVGATESCALYLSYRYRYVFATRAAQPPGSSYCIMADRLERACRPI